MASHARQTVYAFEVMIGFLDTEDILDGVIRHFALGSRSYPLEK